MDSLKIAVAARKVALDLGCIGTPEQDRIATAFEKFADLIDPRPVDDTDAAATCPACGDKGTYWEDRVPVHDSIVGFEIREAGIEHPDGRLCTEW
jgi:hypothetical protein